MISCDTNILVLAYNESSPEQPAAFSFLEENLRNRDFAISELVLTELYVVLRSSAVLPQPMNGPEAVEVVSEIRANRYWTILKGTIDVSDRVWKKAKEVDFPRRAIFDARIAYSLSADGVKRFATKNVKDFARFDTFEVFDPLI